MERLLSLTHCLLLYLYFIRGIVVGSIALARRCYRCRLMHSSPGYDQQQCERRHYRQSGNHRDNDKWAVIVANWLIRDACSKQFAYVKKNEIEIDKYI